MTVIVLWVFLTVTWVGLQCVIVVFPDHPHVLYRFCLFVFLCVFFVSSIL